MGKRIISILLVFTLIVSMLPVTAFAAESNLTEETADAGILIASEEEADIPEIDTDVDAEDGDVSDPDDGIDVDAESGMEVTDSDFDADAEEADVSDDDADAEEADVSDDDANAEAAEDSEALDTADEESPEDAQAAAADEEEILESESDAMAEEVPLLGAEAAEETEPVINEATGRVVGPAGDEDVAVMVYGKSMSDAVNKVDYDFDTFVAALKSELQGILANEKLPDVEMYLVNDNNEEYALKKNAVKDASFLSSFQYEAYGLIGFTEYVVKFLQDVFGWTISGIDTIGEFYKIYGAKDVPEGDYTLEIRQINGDGYTLWQPEHGTTRVHVGDDHVNYVGYKKELGGTEISIGPIDILSVKFSMPGVFFNTKDPGFYFTSADLGGSALPGTEYVLINRDETVKIIKAAYRLGKDTFNNAMDLVGTEGYTWEELSILNNQVLYWDQEGQQISINGKQAYKLLQTYWALVEASAMDPMINFMSNETNLKLPAILKAKANSDGTVFFGENKNVTLVWSLEILLRMGNVVLDSITDEDIKEVEFADEQTEAIVRLVLSLAKYGAAKGVEFWDDNGNLVPELINDWIYPILQNDNMMEFAKDALIWAIGKDDLTEADKKMLQLLPTHALLTRKMPSGYYMMVETSVPNGYLPTPLFYTMKLTWNTENSDPATWCYMTMGNVGLVLPYFAEDYYTYLRDFNATAEADRILNLITDGKTGDMIQDIISNRTDVSGLMIAYYTNIIYNYMGGSKIYGSEADLAADLTKYLYAHGRTAQNLLIFGNEVARKSKAVITGKIDINWRFYTGTTSIRTNLALRTKAILQGIADSIDTTGNNKINAAAKEAVQKLADSIDTTNRIIEKTTEIQNNIKEKAETTANNIAQKALDLTKKTIKTIFGWARAK